MRVPLPGISREQSVTLIIGPPQNRFLSDRLAVRAKKTRPACKVRYHISRLWACLLLL